MIENTKDLQEKIASGQIRYDMLIDFANQEELEGTITECVDTLAKMIDEGILSKGKDTYDEINRRSNLSLFLYSFVRLLDSVGAIDIKQKEVVKSAAQIAQEVFDKKFKKNG